MGLNRDMWKNKIKWKILNSNAAYFSNQMPTILTCVSASMSLSDSNLSLSVLTMLM